MSRQRSKSIDQVEQEFLFKETDAKSGKAEDKRTAPKEFQIVRDGTGLCVIKYTAGGEVPDALKGRYTNLYRAQDAIDNYIKTKEQQQGGAAGSSAGS